MLLRRILSNVLLWETKKIFLDVALQKVPLILVWK